MESGVLLVKDLPAEKSQSSYGGFRSSSKPVNALKGELLIAIPGDKLIPRNDGGKPHNYRLAIDATVSLRAEADDVAPHSPREFALLEAVKEPNIRYSIFLSIGKLDWASSLRVGSEVYVLVNPEAHQSAWVYSKAVVRWFGILGDLRGTFFGVEITEENYNGQGLTDGTFQGKRYFHCQDKSGFFVSLDKLSPHGEGNDLAAIPPSGTRYSGHSHDQSKGQSQQSQQSGPTTRSKTGAGKQETPKPPAEGPRFKATDRVIVYSKKGTAIHGTVRWVGKHKNEELKSTYVCGLEMDVPVKKSEFPDALPDSAHLIKAASNKKLFLFEPFIRFEDEAALAKKPQKFTSASTDTSVDPEAVAQQFGASPEELVEDELEALKQAHERKQKEGLPEDVNIQEQVEAMRQLEKENKDKMKAKVQNPDEILRAKPTPHPDDILRAKPTPHPRDGRPSSAEISGAPTGRSRFVHSASDASYDRGNSAQPQQPPQYDHQLHLAATGQPGDPNRPPPARQRSFQQERHYEAIDELIGSGSQEHGPSVNMPVHHQQPPQQNLHYDQHTAGVQDHLPPPQYQGQPAPQHRNSSTLPSNLQRNSSSPQQSPQLAQHDHGRQSHQQLQPSQPYPSNHPPLVKPPAIAPSPAGESDPALSLGIGSMVEVSDPPHYGVLRWIGELAEVPGIIAGVELEEGMNGCSDGSRNGVKYFSCKPGRGLFCPLSSLRPDERFTIRGETPGAAAVRNPLWKCPLDESFDQQSEDIDVSKYIGDERGIQGHQNSCYLDATVFGLFAVSDVFDSMFLGVAPNQADQDPSSRAIKEILWKRIVNPLRKHGVVRYESVMALRNKLEEIGKMKGVNQDEKDPEEFLNMLFKHVLHVEPFITIKRPFGVEQEYFVQLFLEFDERVKIPSVGFLLRKMFREQSISFTVAPPKLLIQVPRFGKKFKTYEKIVPDMSLDVGELLPSPYKCFICEEFAWKKCYDCASEFKSRDSTDVYVYFCDTCCDRAHRTRNHQVEIATAGINCLQLLSVICIETSHYVCFAHTEGKWIFLDSMANRVYDTYNIPKGVDCTRDLSEWVYTQDRSRLLSTPPRELPEYVRRFTQDIYMCVYINPDASMYL